MRSDEPQAKPVSASAAEAMAQAQYFIEKAALYEALYNDVLNTFASSPGASPCGMITTPRGTHTPSAIVTSKVLAELLRRADASLRRALKALEGYDELRELERRLH